MEVNINQNEDRELVSVPFNSPSGKHSKPSSDDKASLVMTSDRKGLKTMRFAKLGRIDRDSFEKTGGRFVSKGNIFCSEAHASIAAWAKRRQLVHYSFVGKIAHIKKMSYHIQSINSRANLYKRWLKSLYDMTAKYLQQYFNWFVSLQRIKKSANELYDLIRTLLANSKAIKTYRNIKEFNLELYLPHYSNT
jgi:hypothetical protein